MCLHLSLRRSGLHRSVLQQQPVPLHSLVAMQWRQLDLLRQRSAEFRLGFRRLAIAHPRRHSRTPRALGQSIGDRPHLKKASGQRPVVRPALAAVVGHPVKRLGTLLLAVLWSRSARAELLQLLLPPVLPERVVPERVVPGLMFLELMSLQLVFQVQELTLLARGLLEKPLLQILAETLLPARLLSELRLSVRR